MKKILMLALAVMTINISIAQDEFGIRIGGSYNDTRVEGLAPDLIPETKIFEGFTIGAYYNITLLNGFSFSPGLNYTQKGFVLDEGLDIELLGADLPLGIRAETKIDYLELPAIFRYTIPSGIGEFYFEAGPTLGYAIQGEVRTKARAIIDINIAQTRINLNNDIYRRVELSGQVGLGAAVKAGPGKLFANVRFQRGFSDMIDNPTIDLRLRNTSVNFGVGYAHVFGNYRGNNVPLRPSV